MCSLQGHIQREIRARAEREATPIYEATLIDHAQAYYAQGGHLEDS